MRIQKQQSATFVRLILALHLVVIFLLTTSFAQSNVVRGGFGVQELTFNLTGTYTNPDENVQITVTLTPPITEQVIFYGDSRTAGTPFAFGSPEAYPHQVALLINANSRSRTSLGEDDPVIPIDGSKPNLVRNKGVGGATMSGVGGSPNLTALAQSLVFNYYSASFNRNTIVLAVGINDFQNNIMAATLRTQITTFVTATRNAGFQKIYVSTVEKSALASTAQNNERIAFNSALRTNYAFADGLIDFDRDGRLQNTSDTTYFQSDGLHFTAQGNIVKSLIAVKPLSVKQVGGFHFGGAVNKTWKARFAPDMAGVWTWSASIVENGNPPTIQTGSFTVGAQTSTGFIKRHPTNNFRWISDDGTPFNPLGIGDCVFERPTTGSGIFFRNGRRLTNSARTA